MVNALTAAQAEWAESTLGSMTLDEKIGHLLCPSSGESSEDELKALLDEVPLGSIFFSDWKHEEMRHMAASVQEFSRIPVLVCGDMEVGPKAGTMFTRAMGCSAANSPELMRERGRVTAREVRSMGVHWSFAPVIDLIMNFQNPELSVRSWGDTPEQVLSNVIPLIEGMQEGGLLAATAKHFPGLGMDDRDQHLCTAVNRMSRDEWMASYGKVWQGVIDAGVWTLMVGHIAVPALQGCEDSPWEAMPATISPELQVNVLRRQLGFDGVIMSDANCMIGIASRIPIDEMVVRNIETGGDVFLFGNPRQEFKRLKQAVEDGRLTEERIDQSVRRVIELKARLNLFGRQDCDASTDAQQQQATELAQTIADRSITIVRKDESLPLKLKPGAKVLTVTIKNKNPREEHRCPPLTTVDDELRERGFEVEHLQMPGSDDIAEKLDEVDAVFINLHQPMHSVIGTIRLVDHMPMAFWNGWWNGRKNIVFTSFGSPYHLYEFPHWPNMVLAYGATPEAQRAAVKVWLGEQDAVGTLPSAMPVLAGPVSNVRK